MTTITIAQNPCTQCGKEESTQNGLCLACITKNLEMLHELIGKSVESGKSQAGDLLDNHITDIEMAYMKSCEDLSISFTMKFSKSEKTNTIDVKTKIRFISETIQDGVMTEVTHQEKLPL
jgi:hypothetical protein